LPCCISTQPPILRKCVTTNSRPETDRQKVPRVAGYVDAPPCNTFGSVQAAAFLREMLRRNLNHLRQPPPHDPNWSKGGWSHLCPGKSQPWKTIGTWKESALHNHWDHTKRDSPGKRIPTFITFSHIQPKITFNARVRQKLTRHIPHAIFSIDPCCC